uniref:Retrotransposon gag protein n=1 Tax=Solanum tuberosum TaxID=4113 RepID=M1DV66_SOLTU
MALLPGSGVILEFLVREIRMDDHYGYHTDHPLLKLLNLRDNLLTFKKIGDETIQEMWLKFHAVLQLYSSHGMTDKALQECFYRDLGPKNRSIADQLCSEGTLHQLYEVIAKIFDGMAETNKDAKTKQEWDTLVTQMDVLSKRVIELEVQAMEKEKHFLFRERKHGKKHGGVQNNEAISLIQQQLEEQDKKLNEMKDNIKMLNETSTANSMTIQLQDAQITHLMTGRYPLFAEDSPNYTMADSEDKE